MAFPFPSLVFLICHMLISLTLTTAQSQGCSNKVGTFTINSTYSNNLNLILSSLPPNVTTNGGFYNGTAGQDPDKVYVLALCRGDLTSEDCSKCINSSSQGVTTQCPYQKEAIKWGDRDICLLRYSNHYFFGTKEVSPSQWVPNPNNMSTDFDQFNQTLYNLMERLITRASLGSSSLKFAAGNADFTSSRNVYGLVQCTPDISQTDCRTCLEGAVGDISRCCGGKEGGRVLRPSCLVWFELFPFYDSGSATTDDSTPSPPTLANSPPLVPSTQLTPPTSGRSTTFRTAIIIVVPTVSIVTLAALTWAILRRRKRKSKLKIDDDDAMKRLESLQYDFSTIKAATNDFSDANKLGQGGFGSVYKGRLPNGQEIAVKRLSGHSSQGEQEFKNEILLLAKLQHRNLVSLLGFCLEGKERILIYEFLGSGSLDHFIFDPIKRGQLNSETRYKIIYGIARGILYLHEDSRLKIIHRDLKASNILLDREMNPKISDFGMARLFVMDQSQEKTLRVVGTYGYMAPEYLSHGRFSVKSDVFSFGVLVLEIVSGKKKSWVSNSDDVELLLTYAWKNWREGTAENLVDQTLGGISISEMMRCIHIGLLCVQENEADRPTIASVVQMLNSHSLSLPSPARPAFFMYSGTEQDLPSQESSSGSTESKLSIARDGAYFLLH